MQQSIIITGGTGTVGTGITKHLTDLGYTVHIFTRTPNKYQSTAAVKYFAWDTIAQTYDVAALENAIALVNLAGEGVADNRWSAARKQAIVNSRVNAGKLVTAIITQQKHSIATLVQASAIGWYAPNAAALPNQYQEDLPHHTDYLGSTCAAWENSIASLHNSALRIVTLRIGIVLNEKGGMAKELAKPMQLGVLPVFDSGTQIVPWIHQQDINNMVATAIKNEKYNGTYNAVASQTDTQKQVALQIAKTLGRRNWFRIPIPAFILKIMLGEMSVEILKSSKIDNAKIKNAGYNFVYPALENIDKL